MKLLHWVLAPQHALPAPFPDAWGPPPERVDHFVGDAQFSVLYSDIGKSFYRQCGPDGGETGWLERDSIATVLELSGGQPKRSHEHLLDGRKWNPLSEDDVKLLYEHEAHRMKATIAQIAKTLPSSHVVFTFLPNEGVGAFNIQRTMTFTTDMRPRLPTSIWGTILLPSNSVNVTDVSSESEEHVFATWTLDVQTSPRAMVVTRFCADPATLPALLDALVEAAQTENIDTIEFWGLPEKLKHAAEDNGWTSIDRPEHLSAFKWYGPEREDNVIWSFNEKSAISSESCITHVLTTLACPDSVGVDDVRGAGI